MKRARWFASTYAAAGLFIVLTAWFTAPQIVSLDRVVVHQDPPFSTWRLAWIAHQWLRAPLHLLDSNILHPLRHTAVFSDAMPLLGTVAAPLFWIGVPAVVAYNVMLLAAFVTAALGAFLLVRELTGSTAAGLVSGIIFGFSPLRFDHYMHLEILWSCWIPVTLWALHRTIATDRWTFGLLTGLCLAAQVFSCLYLAVFLATWLVFIGLLLVLFGVLDLRARAFRALLVGGIVGAALVAPYGRAYVDASRIVGVRSTEETAFDSAEVDDYLSSPSSNRLYGWTMARWGANEKQLFPGLTAMVLAIVGLWPAFSRLRVIYAMALLFAFDLSLGFNGLTFATLRETVPFFRGLRVMARAATLVQLGLAVLGGCGVSRLLQIGRDARAGEDGSPTTSAIRPWTATRGWIGSALAVLAGVLIVVEYTNRPIRLVPLPTQPSVLARWLADQRGLVLLELPVPRMDRLPGADPRYQFMSTFHWQKLVNGYSSFVPPSYARLMDMMESFPDARSLGAVRALGVTHLVTHTELYAKSDARALVERLSVSPDFAFVGWFPDAFGPAAVFHLLAGPA